MVGEVCFEKKNQKKRRGVHRIFALFFAREEVGWVEGILFLFFLSSFIFILCFVGIFNYLLIPLFLL